MHCPWTWHHAATDTGSQDLITVSICVHKTLAHHADSRKYGLCALTAHPEHRLHVVFQTKRGHHCSGLSFGPSERCTTARSASSNAESPWRSKGKFQNQISGPTPALSSKKIFPRYSPAKSLPNEESLTLAIFMPMIQSAPTSNGKIA
jgi:hypothetical protein